MSVCDRSRDYNKPDDRDFVITRMITDRIGLHSVPTTIIINIAQNSPTTYRQAMAVAVAHVEFAAAESHPQGRTFSAGVVKRLAQRSVWLEQLHSSLLPLAANSDVTCSGGIGAVVRSLPPNPMGPGSIPGL